MEIHQTLIRKLRTVEHLTAKCVLDKNANKSSANDAQNQSNVQTKNRASEEF